MAVVDQRREPADGGGHHRRPAGGRLERHEPEGLGAAGDDAHVGGAVVRRQQLVGLGVDEVDVLAHAAGVGRVVQPLQRLLPVRPAGPADDHQPVGLPAVLEQLGQRLDRHVGALERLDAADEEQQAAVEGEAEGAAGLGPVARAEERVVDAGRHDADAPGVAAVERHDLVGLDGARRQHGVGAVDDGRLGLGPAVRHVRLDLLGHRLGLHPVEGVERAHERQVQLVLDHVAREPRQPVVGVHRRVGQPAAVVVARRRRGGHPLEDTGRELVDDAGQGLLGHRVERAGRHVVHAQPGLDVDDRRGARRTRPG